MPGRNPLSDRVAERRRRAFGVATRAMGGLLLLLAHPGAQARTNVYSRDNYRDVRWVGRGNTGVASISDGSALFYNPAGLAFSPAYSLTVLNPFLGADQSFVSSAREAKGITSGGKKLTERFSPFLGKPLSVQGGIFPNLAIPNFAVGFWDYADAQISYRNPVNPEFDVQGRNDYGFITGGAARFRNFSAGGSIRFQRRKLVKEYLTGGSLLNVDGNTLKNLVRSGDGWGLNLGAQYMHELGPSHRLSFGTTVEDVGNTKFRNQKGGRSPEPQRQQINAGATYGFDSTFIDGLVLFDMRQIRYTDMSYTKKIYMGTELSFLYMDFRGGFFQGNWTAGLSLRFFPIFTLDFSTYGEELDYAAGIRRSRIYMIGLRSGLQMKKAAIKKSRLSLDDVP